MTIFDEFEALTRKVDNKLIATGTMIRVLYILDTVEKTLHNDASLVADMIIWHDQLPHLITVVINSMVDNGIVRKFILKTTYTDIVCVG